MRILHFSDLHIGVENYGRTDPETGLSTRLLDFLDTYDQLVQYAIDEQVDLVLFAGDAYKSRDPSQTHQREFASRIATLVQHNIPVFLLVGNHDLPAIASRATALEIFPTLEIPNVYVADRLTTTLIETRSGPIQIISLPWIRRSAFLAREETHNLNLQEINQQLEGRITRLLQREIAALDTTLPAVLTGHISLNTAVTSSETSMMLGHDHIMLQSNISDQALDYVALGHVHKHQILSSAHPMVVYSGSLQRVDFGEEKDVKGFCIIDLDSQQPTGNRLISFQFRPVQARPFLTIAVNIEAGQGDPTEIVLSAIRSEATDGAIVRVQIHLPEEIEPFLRDQPILEALGNAHYVASIQRDVVRKRRPRLSTEAVENMTPTEVLARYLEDQGVTQVRQEKLRRVGESLIHAEIEREQNG